MTAMLVPMNCSITGRPFLVSTKLSRWNRLRLLENHPVSFGPCCNMQPLHRFATKYATAAHSWRGCPHCGAFDNSRYGGAWLMWTCHECAKLGQVRINCAGRDRAG